MKIPLIGEPDMPGPQQSFRPIDTTTFDKVGQAGERLGQAIQGVAEDLPVRIKTVYDDASKTKIATAASAAKADAVRSLTNGTDGKGQPLPENNDPSTYAQRWQEARQQILASARQDPAYKTLGPRARVELDATLGNVLNAGDADVRDVTRTKMLSVAGAINEVALDRLVQVGREDEAQALRAKLVSTGERTPEWGAQTQIEIPQKIDRANALHLMSTPIPDGGGPFVAQDKLQQQDADGHYAYFKRLLPEQRQELLRQTAWDGRIERDRTRDKYANYIADQKPIDPMEVKADVVYRLLDQSQAKSLLKPPAPAEDNPQGFASLMNRISSLNPEDRNYPEQFEIGQSISNFTGVNRTRAEEYFHEKMNPHSPINTEAVKTVLGANAQLFSHGGYGDFEITVPASRPLTQDSVLKQMGIQNMTAATPEQRHEVADKMMADQKTDHKETKRFLPNVQIQAQIKRAAVDQKVLDYVRAHPGSENDEKTLMGVYAEASRAQRGAVGISLFNPPQLAPTAPQ